MALISRKLSGEAPEMFCAHHTQLRFKAIIVLQFIQGLLGLFEEGTWATWLYDLVKPQVMKVALCQSAEGGLAERRQQE